MSYKNYTWPHNPAEISVEETKNLKEFNIPFFNNVLQNYGRKKRIVKGKGEFFGEDCIEQFQKLRELYAQEGIGYLKLPNMTPFLAVFYALEMLGSSSSNTVEYAFEFWEEIAPETTTYNENDSFYTAKEADNLWSIGLKYGLTVDELLAMNPDIKRPDALAAGQRVRIA